MKTIIEESIQAVIDHKLWRIKNRETKNKEAKNK